MDSLSYEKTQNTLEFFFLFVEVILGVAATAFATIAWSIVGLITIIARTTGDTFATDGL